jgi:exodeoxyribonuclease-3
MRLVAWNCAMALHRKFEALLRLRPDVAVIAECAEPGRLAERLALAELTVAWSGSARNPHKGPRGLRLQRLPAASRPIHRPSLRYLAPVRVEGPVAFNLLAVWAQNFSAGIRRKRQPGPLRLGLSRYREFLAGASGGGGRFQQQ